MIAATRRWVRRNRANLVIGAGVVGAGYLAGQYVLNKIQEARQRMSEERVSKENLRRRFEQNQEDCTYTVLALLPTVRDEIMPALPVEQITEQLQQERQERLRRMGASETTSEYPSVPPSVVEDDGKSLSSGSYIHASQADASTADIPTLRPKKSKAQLWQDMKINSVTRALSMIYTLSLLTILTRIQLNLLGRRTYLSSVVALATPPPAATASTISLENKDDDNYENFYGNDFETNRKYLTFSWWLLHRGSRQIMEKVMGAVKEVFGAVNIREDVTLERLGDLVMQVRRKVEGETEAERHRLRWLAYLLPPTEDEAFVIRQSGMSEDEGSPSPESRADEDPMMISSQFTDADAINGSLRRLLDETSDLIDSPTFTQVLTHLLDAGYSRLVDHHIAIEAFKAIDPTATAPGNEFQPRVIEINETKCKLAHILPVFCKQAHTIAAGSGELDVMAGVAAQAGLGNDYLSAMDRVPDLEAFAAVIYSSNFEYEVAEGDAAYNPRPAGQSSSSSPSSTRQSTPRTVPVIITEAAHQSQHPRSYSLPPLQDLPPQPMSDESDPAAKAMVPETDQPSEVVAPTTEQSTIADDGAALAESVVAIEIAEPEPSLTMDEGALAESTVVIDSPAESGAAVQQQQDEQTISVPLPAETVPASPLPAPPAFEGAWQKALAAEDGRKESDGEAVAQETTQS